jgi:hypothetical protein
MITEGKLIKYTGRIKREMMRKQLETIEELNSTNENRIFIGQFYR